MVLVTLYALFADDCRQGFFDKKVDGTFYVITSICLLSFLLEITLTSASTKGYFNSMYFWLDLVSTLSMITDIGWIMDIITETSDFNANNAEQATNLARAGRGARIGTRVGRITRVIRLVRLVRIIQLYKKVKPKTKVEVDDEFEKLDRINKKTENKENALTIPD